MYSAGSSFSGGSAFGSAATARWDELRKEARKLEAELDSKLVGFSKLGSAMSASSASYVPSTSERPDVEGALPEEESRPLLDEQWRKCKILEDDIEDLTDRLQHINDQMHAIATAGGAGPSPGSGSGPAPVAVSSVYAHTLQRHKEILHDYQQEFRKYKSSINASRERAELFSSVRHDLSNYKGSANGGFSRSSDSLLRERNAIHDADRTATDALATAAAARESLSNQRSSLLGIRGRIVDLRTRFPTIDALMVRIGRKKKRDVLILGVLIAVCLIFTLLYLFR